MIDNIHKLSKNYENFTKHRDGVSKFLDFILSTYEEKYQKSSSDENDETFFGQMYKIRDRMTYEEMKESTFTFFAAGSDTTGKLMPSILLLLAMNPEKQEKLCSELKEILSSDDEDVTEEHLSKMIYLDQVIKEGARLFPPVPIMAREIAKNIELGKRNKSC